MNTGPGEIVISLTLGVDPRYRSPGKASKIRLETKTRIVSGTCWLKVDFSPCASSQALMAMVALPLCAFDFQPEKKICFCARVFKIFFSCF
jgi:hypothetical protein